MEVRKNMSIQVLRGPSVSTDNRVLPEGQPYVDIESNPPKLKIGDGTTGLNDLPYIGASVAQTATKATQDGSGNLIVDTYATKEELSHSGKRTCRFVIGTSTNGWTANDCDYLCDGIADEVEINQAIQALPSSGGFITILDGVYSITSSIILNKNISIFGYNCTINEGSSFSGDAMISCQSLAVLRGLTIYTTSDKLGVKADTSNKISIIDSTIISNGTCVLASRNCTITRSEIRSGLIDPVIVLNNGSYCKIYNNNITGFAGIKLNGCTNINIHDNVIIKNEATSGQEEDAGSVILENGSNNNLIHSNRLWTKYTEDSTSNINNFFGNIYSENQEIFDAPGGILIGNIKLVYNEEKDSIDFIKIS